MNFTGVVEYSTPKLNTFWHYARVELTPPTPADIPKISAGLQSLVKSAKTGKWKQVPVKVLKSLYHLKWSFLNIFFPAICNLQEAWLNTLITAEIAFWFFVGECIGKGSLVGYQV